jgi:hypothetical protein
MANSTQNSKQFTITNSTQNIHKQYTITNSTQNTNSALKLQTSIEEEMYS